MSEQPQATPTSGTVSWMDLTVPNAEDVRDFYQKVTGWKAEAVEMDGYNDFCMIPAEGDAPVAGICHARGANANLPAQWLIYINVTDLKKSAAQCVASGGKILAEPREVGGGKFCVIQDPAGAIAGLYQA